MNKAIINCATGSQATVALDTMEQAAYDERQAAAAAAKAQREQDLAALALLRQALAGELGTRLTTAPGKAFTDLTDREILHMVVRVMFNQFVDTGILDAAGVVQPLDQWRV